MNRSTRCLPTLLVLLVSLAATAWGQQPPSREQVEQHARAYMEQLSTRLALSDEQAVQVEPVLSESVEELGKLRESFRGKERSRATMQAMRSEMEQLQQRTRDQLAPILSAEQLAAYDEFQQERQAERRKSKGKGKRAARAPGGS